MPGSLDDHKYFVFEGPIGSGGANTVVTNAPPDGDTKKRIHVYDYQIENISATTTTSNFNDSTPADLTTSITLTADGANTDRVNPPASIFYTAPGADLTVTLSGANTHAVNISYFYDERPLV